MRKKDKHKKVSIPLGEGIAIIIAVISLFIALGSARWSWYMVDEQVRLRQEFLSLQNKQEQVHLQYEFWLQKIQEEREAMKGM